MQQTDLSGILGHELRGAYSLLTDLKELKDADPRDLGSQQIAAMRAMFENEALGLYLFNQHIMGYADLTLDLHLPICRLIGRWGQTVMDDGSVITTPPGEAEEPHIVDSYRRLMICIPREHFKTSCCTRGGALWTLVKDPNATVGIYNAKAENAEAWVGAICQIVERSHLFQALWPEMLPRGISYKDKEDGKTLPRRWKWGGTGLMFERSAIGVPELSIEPHGIGGESAGKHFTHMILDDIIGKEAAYSVATMQSAIDWVDNKRPLERPAENGCEMVVHTPWAYHDVYRHMREKWPGEYKVHRRHALEDAEGNPDPISGKSIFPQKLSTRKIKRMLKTDPFVNSAQYMCVPKAGKNQSFNEDSLGLGRVVESSVPLYRINKEFYDPELLDLDCFEEVAPQVVPINYLEKAIILDPAPTKPMEIKRWPKASNGIVVVGIDPWGRHICLESLALKVGPTDILHACMALCEKWGTHLIAIEEVNFSAVYAPLFEAIIRHEYDWMPDFAPCRPGTQDKIDRIVKNLQRVVENRFWYFNEATTAPVRKELAEFPHCETIDCIDALSYTDSVISRPLTVTETDYYHAQQRGTRLGVTGYGEFERDEAAHA